MTPSPQTHYDVAVIGLGTMGSFAAVELARQGFSVAGFDQFTPPHSRGSHSGGMRIYRLAYPEGTGYVPLAQRAGSCGTKPLNNWAQSCCTALACFIWGGLANPSSPKCGRAHPPIVYKWRRSRRVRYSAAILRSKSRRTTSDSLMCRPAGSTWTRPSLPATRMRRALAFAAFDQRVKGWDATTREVRVHLEKETITAANLIITAGAWASELLRDLQLPLAVKRKVVAWFDPLDPALFAPDRIPVFSFSDNFIYGFPSVPGLGVRLAEHLGRIPAQR